MLRQWLVFVLAVTIALGLLEESEGVPRSHRLWKCCEWVGWYECDGFAKVDTCGDTCYGLD